MNKQKSEGHGRWLPNNLSIENLVFSVGGGFLFGAVAGYTIMKVMEIAAVVIGLFVVGLSYLSYKGWIAVKWMEMENATKTTLTNVAGQVGHALNKTASQFAAHSTTIETSGYLWQLHLGLCQDLCWG
jgi:uncharacterized membrane protein (Fun14 family)